MNEFLRPGRLWWQLVLLSVLLLATRPCGAEEEDLVIARAVMVDASGSMALEQARSQTYSPAGEFVSRGYTASVAWLRLDLAAAPRNDLVLMVTPTFLDDVRLYAQDSSGAWQERRTGDHLPFSQRETKFTAFAWRIDLPPGSTSRVYLRVSSTSAVVVRAKAYSEDAAAQVESTATAVVAMVSVLTLAMAVVSALRFFSSRDPLWAYAAVFQTVGVLVPLVLHGVLTRYLWSDSPAWGDKSVSVMASLHHAAGSLYFWQFIRTYKAGVWAQKVLLAIAILACTVLLGLIALGMTRTAMQINTLALLLSSAMGLILPFLMRFDDAVIKWMTRTLYLSMAVYLGALLTAPLMGLRTPSVLSFYGGMLSNLFGSAMLMAILSRRFYLQRLEHERAKDEVKRTTERLVWERQRSEETAHLMGMLMHELKNPLAAIRLSVMTLRVQSANAARAPSHRIGPLGVVDRSVEAIDTLLERCRQVDRMEHGQSAVQMEDVDAVHMFQMVVGALEPGLRARVELHTPFPIALRGDAFLLQTICTNLLDNALHYSPAGTMLRCSLTLDVASDTNAASALLRVANAVGVAGKPDPAKVFGKYYREAYTQQRSGAGLGLYLVRGLAQAMGGTAEMVTTAEDQVVFEVRLPLPADQ